MINWDVIWKRKGRDKMGCTPWKMMMNRWMWGGTLFSDNFILGFFRDAESDLLWKTSIKFV